MSEQATGTGSTVRAAITVNVPQERAFEVFATRFGTWWPKEYSIGPADMADFVVEPQVGGRWYELGVDGTECDTGKVLAYEPPDRLTLAWHLDATFTFDPDPAHASEVDVRFVAEGPDRTRVELVHGHIERHPDPAAVHDSVSGEGGWGWVLDFYAKATAEAS